MKKIAFLLIALFLIAGCSSDSHYSFVFDGDEVLFTGPNNQSYTKADLYKSMKYADQSVVLSNIFDNIAMKLDGVDMEQIEADADTLIETYDSMGYGPYIISSYGSYDAYKKSYISSLLLSELSKAYVDSNLDTLIADKKPVKMQMASFKNLEDAEKCIEDAKNGSTFDMAAVNNNADNAPSSSVYTDDDASLTFEVKEYLNSNDSTGLSDIIVTTSQGSDDEGNAVDVNTYYVLNVESRNVEDFREELVQLLSAEASSDEVKEYFLSTHDIEFFDQDLYETLSAAYEVLK